MSIATELTRLQTAKANIKTSIENKGVEVSSSALLDAYPALIDSIPTGGGAVEEKTVNFIDFDGTLVASYTGDEAQALTALPDGPDHSSDDAPLTFDSWNWTLAEIKQYNTSYPTAVITVGANYHTTDGKTHLFFDTVGLQKCTVSFSMNDAGTVDWGDGSATESFSEGLIEHTYTNGLMNHCIVDSTGYVFINENIKTDNYQLAHVRLPSITTTIAFYYSINLKDISIPSGATYIGQLTSMDSLVALVLPSGITGMNGGGFMPSLRYFSSSPQLTNTSTFCITDSRITSLFIPNGNYIYQAYKNNSNLKNVCLPNATISGSISGIFSKCYCLQEVVMNNAITTIPASMFEYCYAMKKAYIPSNITQIGGGAFRSCTSLAEVVIPSSVTQIGSDTFQMVAPQYITALPTTPPTLNSGNFLNNSRLKKIYVPYSSDHSVLAAYQAATNWSKLASKMEELPE